jgi:transcriptional regulator with XRE-family HTH domain
MQRSLLNAKRRRLQALLVTARKQAGLTQVELAAKLRKPQSYVSKYENGERRLDLVEFLEVAELLNISPTSFLKQIHDAG